MGAIAVQVMGSVGIGSERESGRYRDAVGRCQVQGPTRHHLFI